MTQILIGTFDADRAFVARRANRPSNSALSPAVTECFDIVALPGASEVTSQVDWLSSNDTNTVATPSFVAADSMMGRADIGWGIGILHPVPMTTVSVYQSSRRRGPMESLCYSINLSRRSRLRHDDQNRMWPTSQFRRLSAWRSRRAIPQAPCLPGQRTSPLARDRRVRH